MRQFNYNYRSFMENRHGFVTMLPHPKLLHPYMGIAGGDAYYPVVQHIDDSMYGTNFAEFFKKSNITSRHKVKMFFPEIKKGLATVGDIKYSANSNPEDTVSVSGKIITDGKYEEYIVIDNFLAEFEVEVSVDFGSRITPSHPVEVVCDYIDIFVFNQRISLTVHDNTLLFVPYAMSYPVSTPPEAARAEASSTNLEVNSDASYGFILNKSAKDAFVKRGFSPTKIDTIMLDIEKKKNVAANDFRDMNEENSLSANVGQAHGISEKHIMVLPRAIFPAGTEQTRYFSEPGKRNDIAENTGYENIPLLLVSGTKSCCEIKKGATCSPHFEKYKVFASEMCPIPKECMLDKCKAQSSFVVENRIVNTLLALMELPFEEMDVRVYKQNATLRRLKGIADRLENDIVEEI